MWFCRYNWVCDVRDKNPTHASQFMMKQKKKCDLDTQTSLVPKKLNLPW